MKRHPLSIALLFLIISCSEPPQLVGLWKLNEASIDMIPRYPNPIFIKFERGGGFYVSKENGDLIGIYDLNKNDLSLSSTDKKWFNTRWTANIYGDELVLKGQEYGFRTTELRFKQVEKFPAFDEFQQELDGSWELYKIETRGKESIVNNMRFLITEEEYVISKNDTLIEQGKISVDTRHQKISFENEETIWTARFVWDELRLENKEMDITYRLRKN